MICSTEKSSVHAAPNTHPPFSKTSCANNEKAPPLELFSNISLFAATTS